MGRCWLWTEGLVVDCLRLECECGMMMCTQVQGSVEAELGGWQRAVEYKRSTRGTRLARRLGPAGPCSSGDGAGCVGSNEEARRGLGRARGLSLLE